MASKTWRRDGATIAERRAKVFELRKVGWPYRRIAAELEVSVATVHDDFRQALEDLLPIEEVEEVRRQEADRLDHLLLLAMQLVADEEMAPALRLKALDRVLAVQARRARLLGLDAPEQIVAEHRVTIAAPEQVSAIRDDLAERRARAG